MRRLRLAVLAVLTALTGACTTSDSTQCGTDGPVCPPNWVCIEELSSCINPSITLCGNGILDKDPENPEKDEECDDGNLTNGDGCNWNCKLPTCGDGFLDPDEVCDDGNTGNNDGCAGDCKSLEVCGNGVKNVGEACDAGLDGVPTETAECNIDCTVPVCGDGKVNRSAGEECDDNGESANCTKDCKISTCGDGYINTRANEHCDEGSYCVDGRSCKGPEDCLGLSSNVCAPRSTSCCSNTCLRPTCGNGFAELEGCSSGDGFTYPAEACDSGLHCLDGAPCDLSTRCSDGSLCQHRSGFGCTANCAAREECGDGVTLSTSYEREIFGRYEGSFVDGQFIWANEPGDRVIMHEVCDNGKLCANGNECDSDDDCASAGSDRRCMVRSMVKAGGTYCSADCLSNNTCGNKYLDPGEECDDGNLDNGDGCSRDCTLEACGNGQLDQNEVCDFGDLNGTGTIPANMEVPPDYCLPEPPEGVKSQASVCGKPCSDRCQNSVCGDGSIDSGETCDPRYKCDNPLGQSDPDSTECYAPSDCADCGILENMELTGELENLAPELEQALRAKCKDKCSLDENGQTCRLDTCKLNFCGDSFVGAYFDGNDQFKVEQCDSGGQNTAECNYNCTIPVCGDGIINNAFGESCDPQTVGGETALCNKNCTIAMCGDGIVNTEAGETCDDTNSVSGDGCSSTCKVESGFSCTTAPATEDGLVRTGICAPTQCGDGIIAVGFEDCDDNNTVDGDGCSSSCVVETGYVCTTSALPESAGLTSNCSTRCGDGIKAGLEACEDSNTFNGDGCSATCTIEPGYVCPEGERCRTTCGDGIIAGGEMCDDGDTDNGDGCSSACTVEIAYTCTALGTGDGLSANDYGLPINSDCTTTCGDGFVAPTEECDDGNAVAGDGCSSTCEQEEGYLCPGYSDVPRTQGVAGGACNSVCGDSIVVKGEECDAGDEFHNTNGPCTSTCRLVSGWVCAEDDDNSELNQVGVRPCTPQTTCGDFLIRGGEVCDDGNTLDGDGCSADCTMQSAGYECPYGSLPIGSTCQPTCGDGLMVGAETCDDSNTVGGDGCSSNCQIEVGWACAGGACAPECGDSIVLTHADSALSEICDEGGSPTAGCVDCQAITAGWYCQPGTPCITLCGDGIEAGPETCDDGNTYDGDGCSASCQLEPGNHYTCIEGEACEAVCGSGSVGIGEECDDNNQASGDGCSDNCLIEPGYTCTEPAYNPDQPNALLTSTCSTTCGDGVKAGAEACDDGNSVNGDGCSSTCTIETGFTCSQVSSVSVCATTCGDNIKASTEACEDGNSVNGDGCTSDCRVELGFTCPSSAGACSANCGDSRVVAGEVCDTGGADSDGCNNCQTITAGYACPNPGAACHIICGDGLKLPEEACDDGNKVNGDGCSSTCSIDTGWECPNVGQSCFRMAVAVADNLTSTVVNVGATHQFNVLALLNNDQHVDFRTFTLPAATTKCGGAVTYESANGAVTYVAPTNPTPSANCPANASGRLTDSFSYSARSTTAQGASASTAAVTFTLNRLPVATQVINECKNSKTSSWSFTRNASDFGTDADGDTLQVSLVPSTTRQTTASKTVTAAGQVNQEFILHDGNAQATGTWTLVANDVPTFVNFTGSQNLLPVAGTNNFEIDLSTKISNTYAVSGGLSYQLHNAADNSWGVSVPRGNVTVKIVNNNKLVFERGNQGSVNLTDVRLRVCEVCSGNNPTADDCRETTISPKLAECFVQADCQNVTGRPICDTALGMCRGTEQTPGNDTFLLDLVANQTPALELNSIEPDLDILDNDQNVTRFDVKHVTVSPTTGCGDVFETDGIWSYTPPADLTNCSGELATLTYHVCPINHEGGYTQAACPTSATATIYLVDEPADKTVSWCGWNDVTTTLSASNVAYAHGSLQCSLTKLANTDEVTVPGVSGWNTTELSWLNGTTYDYDVAAAYQCAVPTDSSLNAEVTVPVTWSIKTFAKTASVTGSVTALKQGTTLTVATGDVLALFGALPAGATRRDLKVGGALVTTETFQITLSAEDAALEVWSYAAETCLTATGCSASPLCETTSVTLNFADCLTDAHCDEDETCNVADGVCEPEP